MTMARLVNGFARVAISAAAVLVGAPGHAQEPQPANSGEQGSELLPSGWLETQMSEAGQRCAAQGRQLADKRLFLACGSAGVWEVALESTGPRFVRSYAFEGDAVGFFTEPDGRVWVKIQVLAARPLGAGAWTGSARFADDLLPPSSPLVPAPAAPAAPPAPAIPPPLRPRTTGKVEATKPGEVLVSLGEADGVSRGDRIELFWPLADGEGSEQLLGVGVVTSVTERTAKVRLGLNEAVEEGAEARPTTAASSASLAAPPRVPAIWSLDLMARPFAAMGELGGGALLSAALGRRFESNWHVRAVLDPAAIGDVQDRDSITAASFTIVGSYDSHYFEMGLGLGAQTVNETGFLVPPGSGFTVAQYLRLGAVDGLNISARTSVVLFHSQFDFGGMVATGQIPVSRGFWLLLGGGGGDVGYGYGEFGLRVLMSGNGHRGSKYLTVTAGGAAVFESSVCDPFGFCDSKAYGGPMAGVGGEWRF